ncbi:MAG: hypothetical protein COC20_01525 [Cellvibrionales bacterium]|nr:MAG: hypothetical protein COC20_01525 [Cellvibrionales bacterium]
MDKYPEIKVTRKTGDEKFHVNGIPLLHDLHSFWQWSASDLVGNALRGILAEYIVASAVGKIGGNRTEWDAYDIETYEGVKVEVKSGAYIQSWSQKQLSKIQFGIRPTQGWDSKTNSYSTEFVRQADVYVFCVLKQKNQETIDPLNLDQWDFYVLATNQLNKTVGGQKTITLGRLKELEPTAVSYGELSASIKQTANKRL